MKDRFQRKKNHYLFNLNRDTLDIVNKERIYLKEGKPYQTQREDIYHEKTKGKTSLKFFSINLERFRFPIPFFNIQH